MQLTVAEMLGYDGADRPILPLTRATRDALARYVAIQAPTGRRKWAQNEWDLSADEARAVCEATASATTIEKVWRHKNGGWRVALPVLGAVIGEPAHAFFQSQIREAAREHERAEQHERMARQAYERLGNDLLGAARAARPEPSTTRQAGDVAGGLRAEAPRRVARR